jgi:hypothetical protein
MYCMDEHKYQQVLTPHLDMKTINLVNGIGKGESRTPTNTCFICALNPTSCEEDCDMNFHNCRELMVEPKRRIGCNIGLELVSANSMVSVPVIGLLFVYSTIP